ncbi:MAG: YjjI family glycine radical enzyme [Elusimicrobiota bacterium]|jgi:YjjI family glycine radical enzyme|nr:YjjI family glycine radical enzyme [Elusimicrobiota bacterium]
MNANDLIYDTITSKKLTYEQKLITLAKLAENSIDVLNIPPRTKHYFETGAINDLAEGHAPYRPRYIQADFGKFLKEGSKFLRLGPAKNLDQALTNLAIIYRHTPSITSFPVYVGQLDELLSPYVDGLTDDEIRYKLKLFLTYLDRTITDSFCHANIGPKATRIGYLILETQRELKNCVPNLTIKYDLKNTDEAFLKYAIETSLMCSNPAIANHIANQKPFGADYGICSCYNILPLSGGAYTLTRITLTELAKEAKSMDHFFNELLPECLKLIADYMNERIKFIVEKSNFFESSFLAAENFISKDRFLGMFGVTGLAEAVNFLLRDKNIKYGNSPQADELGIKIMDKITSIVAGFDALYSPLTGGKFVLHAQVGLDTDIGITSGVRIPVGDEPENFMDHLRHSAKFHHYFPAGVGDIFPIAQTAKNNSQALVDIVKGAFNLGVQYMSFYEQDADIVRITGYLVKRSEMEKYFKGETNLQDTVALGAPNYKASKLAERKVRLI